MTKVDAEWMADPPVLQRLSDVVYVSKTPLPYLSTAHKGCENFDVQRFMDQAEKEGMTRPTLIIITAKKNVAEKKNWPLAPPLVHITPLTKYDLTDGFAARLKLAQGALTQARKQLERGQAIGIIIVFSHLQGGFSKLVTTLLVRGDAEEKEVENVFPTALREDYGAILRRY